MHSPLAVRPRLHFARRVLCGSLHYELLTAAGKVGNVSFVAICLVLLQGRLLVAMQATAISLALGLISSEPSLSLIASQAATELPIH